MPFEKVASGLETSLKSRPTMTRSLPGISRINNKTNAGAAFVLAGAIFHGGGCSEVTVEDGSSCSPVPDCPEVIYSGVDGEATVDEHFYDETGRWRRFDPVTNEEIKVCEPSKRDFCAEGENPQDDGCEPVVCEGVKACDPIPSRKLDAAYRFPAVANYPTSSDAYYGWETYYEHDTDYPVIFDNTPDCNMGNNQGESYYNCDVIPTCEETIPYCDPLPRCKEGQSPISCVEGELKYYLELCLEKASEIDDWLNSYTLSTDPVFISNVCLPEFDPNIGENYYRVPTVKIDCLPIRECGDGEIPVVGDLTATMNCGQWGTWVVDTAAADNWAQAATRSSLVKNRGST